MYAYPCKECADRTVGCHGNCQKYKDAKVRHKTKFDCIKKAKKEEDSIDDYKLRKYEEWVKRHEWRR